MRQTLAGGPAPYYHVNTHRLSLVDMWMLQPGLVPLLVLALFKLQGRRLPGNWWPDPSLIEIPAPRALGSATQALFDELVAGATTAGFTKLFDYDLPPLEPREQRSAMLLADGGTILGIVSVAYVVRQKSRSLRGHFACTSVLRDGTEIGTTDAPRIFPAPPWLRVERLKGSPAVVAARHRQRIAGLPVEPLPADQAGMVERFQREGRRAMDFMLGRGILEPMTPGDMDATRRQAAV